MVAWFHQIPTGTALMTFGLLNTAWTATTWWRDCIIEGDMGMHTEVVKKNMVSGMWVFIVSEAALFFGLLWACLHLGISPSVHLQMQWPPVGIEPIGWDKRALVMSAVLAASSYRGGGGWGPGGWEGLQWHGRPVMCTGPWTCRRAPLWTHAHICSNGVGLALGYEDDEIT